MMCPFTKACPSRGQGVGANSSQNTTTPNTSMTSYWWTRGGGGNGEMGMQSRLCSSHQPNIILEGMYMCYGLILLWGWEGGGQAGLRSKHTWIQVTNCKLWDSSGSRATPEEQLQRNSRYLILSETTNPTAFATNPML